MILLSVVWFLLAGPVWIVAAHSVWQVPVWQTIVGSVLMLIFYGLFIYAVTGGGLGIGVFSMVVLGVAWGWIKFTMEWADNPAR